MKGYLKKTEEGWFVVYDQKTFYDPSAEDGILPLSPKTALYFDMNLTSTILLNKEIEFEIINLTDDKYGIELSYAQLITTDSKKDRTCNHTNCREICPECKLPSDILENVISSQPDWNEEPLNSFGEDFGKDCEAVKNWDSFVEKKNNELEVDKLAEISSELQEATYTLQHKTTYKHGFIDGYNKSKENYEIESSVRELHQYKLGLEDALNLVKKLNKQLMVDSQFTISDDVLFEQAIVAMEEIYGSGCETEIDAYFRGAKWILKQFKK